ncbi:hypothetical protein KKI90_11325 [Xenorhabdus bovienii]|uniref:hypothetical protein n=1 Tax=Xenorhabdus bovienii TaxID=40576 RepID=UPI00237CEEF2|nr:hypothetical protein [Xenorhabdus bovienii]MDE1486953.1 hypothetical protein [Xenorhabdus bovienii]MDE1495659.1 hypothetical protein [Xenorhabdus bovienii]MDE9477795.1 hypothetical protein [Xenorhabdus bovienii]MDE9530673.1 hypothetical protein [Xenorhabdus bovienii]
MDAFSDRIFEEKYKDFLKVRKEWLDIVFKHAVYIDINAQGAACRPVAILTDQEKLSKAEELIRAWQQFTEFAEHKRTAGLSPISSQIYCPVPTILNNVNSFLIGSFEATTTTNFVREDILRKIDKKLNQLHKAKNKDSFTITDLEQDKAIIGSYPAGTMFRRRISGYHDIMLDVSKNTGRKPKRPQRSKHPKDDRYRVGTYGVIIEGNSLNAPDAYDINDGDKLTYNSCYDMISPVRCSLFAGSSLYLISDVERIKEARKTIALQKKPASPITRKNDPAQQEEKRLNKIAEEKRKAQQYAQQKKLY